MTPERSALRAATRDAHDRVDALFSTLDLTTREGLSAFLVAHRHAFDAIRASWTRLDIMDLADPLALIDADLETLGWDRKHHPKMQVPNAGHPLGTAYVIAGAHLGRKVLHRRWIQTGDACVRQAGRYLSSRQFDEVWPRTLSALSGLDGATLADVKIAAMRTFEIFEMAAQDALQPRLHKMGML
ncbi:biliverdin-producing heme oxygenase [Gymnodinialimonas sp. 2305UL16-5]|uniref:biliverdin-producing heme oxygenase n=1 Tax=Gymnodinialimonas mytili TaxID=3126503 RepID=UPI0030AEE85F